MASETNLPIDPKYVDEFGYPCARNKNGFDGGDTAAILGNYICLIPKLERDTAYLIGNLVSMSGKPRRHPDQSKWWGQSDRFSRDQLIPMACAYVLYSIEELEQFYLAHKNKWFLTAWNTRGNGQIDKPKKWPDFTGPEIWALWIRARNPWWARLVLWFLDIETLISAVIWRWFRFDRVCRNHMLVSIVARGIKPTLASRLTYRLNNWNDLIERWRGHCIDVGEPPTDQLFKAYISAGHPVPVQK